MQVRWYSELKDTLAAMIPNVQKDVKEFRAKYGETKVGEVNVDMVNTEHVKWDMPSTH